MLHQHNCIWSIRKLICVHYWAEPVRDPFLRRRSGGQGWLLLGHYGHD